MGVLENGLKFWWWEAVEDDGTNIALSELFDIKIREWVNRFGALGMDFLHPEATSRFMVGTDMFHAHPTLVIFENSGRLANKLFAMLEKEDFDFFEAVIPRSVGYLVMDSPPEFVRTPLEPRNSRIPKRKASSTRHERSQILAEPLNSPLEITQDNAAQNIQSTATEGPKKGSRSWLIQRRSSMKFKDWQKGSPLHLTADKTVLGMLLRRLTFTSDSAVESQDIGNTVGASGGQELCELKGKTEDEWKALEPQLEDIIRRTPTKHEYEPTPTVLLHGFVTRNPDIPKIAISSSSLSYATHLQKTIYKSGILDRSRFKVMILKKPIELSPEVPKYNSPLAEVV